MMGRIYEYSSELGVRYGVGVHEWMSEGDGYSVTFQNSRVTVSVRTDFQSADSRHCLPQLYHETPRNWNDVLKT